MVSLFLLVLACDKDDDPKKHDSIEGYWVVRTPDEATEMSFRIGQDSDGLYLVENVMVKHSGKDYNSKPIDAQMTIVSSNEIESITFVNNSFVAPYFVIRFQEIFANENFTELQINISSFNIDGNFREFSGIKGTRN